MTTYYAYAIEQSHCLERVLK